MIPDNHSKIIQQLLHSLGVTEQYTGFAHTVYATQLTICDPGRLKLITKLLYPDVAKKYNTSWRSVERNIRTVVSVAWKNDPQLLSELAGCSLRDRPNNGWFLAILAGSISRITL